jgi:hypothetical protein
VIRDIATSQAAKNRYASMVLNDLQRPPHFLYRARPRRTWLERARRRLAAMLERWRDAWAVLRGDATACYPGDD